ncbi:MAG: circadian clock protein KaiB [Kosmotogales bacterium]|nr:circadian clock protein KaiB [Kosmotogales bacterium]
MTVENKFVFKLYITGHTHTSERAIENLRRICKKEFDGNYHIVIIDVLECPQMAENEKILATPTLIKEVPPPCRRIIGDLSDEKQLLSKLNLSSPKSKEEV